MAGRRDEYIPVAESIPFDNTGTSFSSDDTRSAIIEALQLAGSSRYPATFGKQGNVTNAYLDRWNQIGSDSVPFIVPEDGIIKSFAIAVSTAVTTTDMIITLYKNGILVDTLTIIVGNTSNSESGLNISVVSNDELSARVTQGQAKDPILDVFIQVGA